MNRSVLAALSVAVLSTSVFAQADLVTARKELMRENGKYVYQAFPAMMKGSQPYDQATVDAGLAQLAASAAKLPALYPAATKDVPPSGRFNASAKVWENKEDFDKRFADFGAAVQAATGKVTDVESLKQAHSAISRTCSDCHEQYRVRN